jgi:hypothetical protein
MATNTISVNSPQQMIMRDTKYDAWIDTLEQNEGCPVNGIIDSNGIKSYGPACFQMQTFKEQVRKYQLVPYANDNELYNWISDEPLQRRLIKLMLAENINNAYKWANTIKKIGMPN